MFSPKYKIISFKKKEAISSFIFSILLRTNRGINKYLMMKMTMTTMMSVVVVQKQIILIQTTENKHFVIH